MKSETQVIENVGLYYVCYKLSLMGWCAMPTARNAWEVDVIAYTKDCSRYIGVQVKTLSTRAPVPIGKGLDTVMGNYWVIVNGVLKDPHSFVLLPNEVKELAEMEVKDGMMSYWLQPYAYDIESFKEAWYRIGIGNK